MAALLFYSRSFIFIAALFFYSPFLLRALFFEDPCLLKTLIIPPSLKVLSLKRPFPLREFFI